MLAPEEGADRMSADRPSAYVCGNCGRGIPGGARWCPVCNSTDLRWVDPRLAPGSVVGLGAPRVVDDRPLWPDAVKPPSVSPNVVPAHEPIVKPMRSRWHAGASTFGPKVKLFLTALYVFYVVWGIFFEFVIYYVVFVSVGGFVLFHVWKKDEVDRTPTPWKEAFRETRESFARDLRERRSRESHTQAVVCLKCGGRRSPGEKTCYRCGGRRWTMLGATVATHACGRCHAGWTDGTRWCVACGAGAAESILIEPEEERSGRRKRGR